MDGSQGEGIVAGHSRPIGGRELAAWLFMRISGLLLIFLAIGHLIIMHIINNVATIDYTFVVWRFTTAFWRTYDGLMLSLALLHGVNGMRTLFEDIIRSTRTRQIVLTSLYGVSIIFWILGMIVLITFHPHI